MRHAIGDVVYVKGTAGGNRLNIPAVIPNCPENREHVGEPEPCVLCDAAECSCWPTVLTLDGVILHHVSDCAMYRDKGFYIEDEVTMTVVAGSLDDSSEQG